MTRLSAFFSASTFALTIIISITTGTHPAPAQGFYEDFATGGAPLNQRFPFGFGRPSGFSVGRPDSGGPIARTRVSFTGGQAPGTIVINTAERRLYLVTANGEAIRYGIGVGRDGFRLSGVHHVSAKRAWPEWTPPAQMRRRQPYLPRHMRGGLSNPLGSRAIYIGSTMYRIHGSNEPETIGHAVSSGCFRMLNQDVIDLYNRVSVGATVIVKN